MDTPQDENEINSLEDPGTVIEASSENDADSNTTAPDIAQTSSTDSSGEASGEAQAPNPQKLKPSDHLRNLISRFNIYLLLFVFILILAIGAVIIAAQQNNKEAKKGTITTQELTQDVLDKLKSSDATVGDVKQTLSVESNAIFAGKVLIRESLDVAGTIRVGGNLSLPGIVVSGNSSFDQIQANNLSISGDTSIQGGLNIQKTLTVSGGGSFGGTLSAPQLNIQTLQLSGDIKLNRHIDAGGGTPTRSNGGALGSGGTTSVNGSDTAGTVTINTGTGPAAGCFITVSFSQKFNATPHVVITPVGSAAASLNYYISRSTSNFSICSTNAAPASSSFSFDYVAID
jgi:cytoskeletal protein CcmA (bactofilin family)